MLDRQVHAVDQLSEIEARREAAEIAVATLTLQQEVLKSRHAASRAMLARRSELDETMEILTADTEGGALATIGEGLYAFNSLSVSSQAGLVTTAEAARRLLDELNIEKTNAF